MPTPRIVSLNPFRCRMWHLHDRLADHVNEETCKKEINSFLKHGQLMPVLGRPVSGDPDYDVELIYGARRLFVARYLNKLISVEVRGITDHEGVVAMDIENRHRTDVSAYERGVGYTRWLRSGLFKTQEEIARTLKISAAQVSRLLKIARLPAVVLDAFNGPINVREGWGLDILDALDDPQRRAATVKAARAICSAAVRPAPGEVYRELLSAAPRGRKVRSRDRDEVVKGSTGQPLFRIRHQAQAIAVLLPRNKLSSQTLNRIRGYIMEALQAESSQVLNAEEKILHRSMGMAHRSTPAHLAVVRGSP